MVKSEMFSFLKLAFLTSSNQEYHIRNRLTSKNHTNPWIVA
ncbi:hypothetical protein LBBP_02604 [Leptospira borgpetersenii serovar Ballum]|uniref:Uncharacterized protein n=1 Tax=Leptospira borgpetersenii serovar Ballum TaxID=280505 RepID=A0A0S2IT42_LEPBO|nr:hypothetical protein LBBP_02604 [Leptospira borgpetersenii serovar Ballum]